MISYCAQGCILEWQTMLPKEVFIFFGRKINFPFFECPKWVFFVKDQPYICCKMGPGHFYNILGHVWFTIDQMVGCQKFWSTSGEKDKFSADSVGIGSNLNCSCLIVCSLFFPKIISRYISIYLIRETPKKSKIQPLARNGHARCFDRILKRA